MSSDYLSSEQMLSILQVAKNEYGTRDTCDVLCWPRCTVYALLRSRC